jgi:hypothetical protein
MLCIKNFKVRDLNDVLEAKGERTFYVVKRRKVVAWGSKPYGGRIEFRPSEESPIIDISVRGKQEARLTGSFVEWVLRNVPEKIVEITVYTPC